MDDDYLKDSYPICPLEPARDNDDTRSPVDERAREMLGWNLIADYDWSDR